MTKKLFDYDPVTGTRQWFHWNDDTDTFTIQTEQKVDDLIEANRESFNQFSGASDKFGDLIGQRTRVASIPMNIYMDLKKKGITKDPKAFKKWLNDPDNAAFRTRPGTV